MIYYDLHIHSCLSPCADDDMTPNNIVNMAIIKELDAIAICDHNCNKNLKAFAKLANKIKIIYGIEIQTIEEVHILALFRNIADNEAFYQILDQYHIKQKNDETYFGNQLIMDENDNIIEHEENLLLTSCNISINKLIKLIHDHHGIAVLAHVLDRKNSICNQLGFIPMGLEMDAIEVKNREEINKVIKMHPYLKDYVFLIDSDAHSLIDISEKENAIDENILFNLWEK